MSEIADAMKKKGMKPTMEITVGKVPPSDDAGEEDASDVEASDDEVSAMKEFEAASSPEEKAMALKAFIKICS